MNQFVEYIIILISLVHINPCMVYINPLLLCSAYMVFIYS